MSEDRRGVEAREEEKRARGGVTALHSPREERGSIEGVTVLAPQEPRKKEEERVETSRFAASRSTEHLGRK